MRQRTDTYPVALSFAFNFCVCGCATTAQSFFALGVGHSGADVVLMFTV